jgi:hypothetical protein
MSCFESLDPAIEAGRRISVMKGFVQRRAPEAFASSVLVALRPERPSGIPDPQGGVRARR